MHLVNRDYEEMARDYYKLQFLDESVDVTPIVPALANFFDDVLEASVSELNFKTITDGALRGQRERRAAPLAALHNLVAVGEPNAMPR